jgi:chemosensory pili system protein ChpC
MSQTPTDVRGVLIQVSGARLLLPNASIAEVLSYASTEPLANAPEWLLGTLRWRGWALPLLRFAPLAGLGSEEARLGNKVLVLKALGQNPRLPYFALLTQGFPRLVTVSADRLGDDAEAAASAVVKRAVRFNDEAALIPDLDAIEQAIHTALATAA